jgi:hypothetical protein
MGEAADFFVSYTSADRAWAEWIAWQLEQAGYQVIVQAWDFEPGDNFVVRMRDALEQADRTLALVRIRTQAEHLPVPAARSSSAPPTSCLQRGTADSSSYGLALAVGFRLAEGRTTGALAQLVHGDVQQPRQQEVALLQLHPALLFGRDRRIGWACGRRGRCRAWRSRTASRCRRSNPVLDARPTAPGPARSSTPAPPTRGSWPAPPIIGM